MKHAIAPEHYSFYQHNGWIEFSDILSAEMCQTLLGELDLILLKRLQLSSGHLKHITPEEKFLAGRDIFRTTPSLKKLIASPDFAGIAASLNDVKQIRLGGDQLLPGGYALQQQKGTLSNYFPFNTVLCGLTICLKGGQPQDNTPPPSDPLAPPIPLKPTPSKEGNILFFKKEKPLLLDFSAHPQDIYLLILYTPQKVFYVHNHADPNSHQLKQLGYQYGDYLTNQKHPLLVR